MIKGTFSVVNSVNNSIRTNEMYGEADRFPTVGEQFVIVSNVLNRFIKTSVVQKVTNLGPGSWEMLTMSGSVYRFHQDTGETHGENYKH